MKGMKLNSWLVYLDVQKYSTFLCGSMEKVLIVQRLSGNNDAGMEKAAKKSLIQASCLYRTLNLPVCWFTSKETIWSSAAVKMTLSHSWSQFGSKNVFFCFSCLYDFDERTPAPYFPSIHSPQCSFQIWKVSDDFLVQKKILLIRFTPPYY